MILYVLACLLFLLLSVAGIAVYAVYEIIVETIPAKRVDEAFVGWLERELHEPDARMDWRWIQNLDGFTINGEVPSGNERDMLRKQRRALIDDEISTADYIEGVELFFLDRCDPPEVITTDDKPSTLAWLCLRK